MKTASSSSLLGDTLSVGLRVDKQQRPVAVARSRIASDSLNVGAGAWPPR
jgi:hypothetical protein